MCTIQAQGSSVYCTTKPCIIKINVLKMISHNNASNRGRSADLSQYRIRREDDVSCCMRNLNSRTDLRESLSTLASVSHTWCPSEKRENRIIKKFILNNKIQEPI